jgi:hypothetical protein
MFLWRLGNNVLPLKSNLARRLGTIDTDCPLCNTTIENERHLFFDCPLAIWFGVNWSLRSDVTQATNSYEILNWVIDPCLLGQDSSLKNNCSLSWAITLETFWNLRNKVLHGNETLKSSLFLFVVLNKEFMNSRNLFPHSLKLIIQENLLIGDLHL